MSDLASGRFAQTNPLWSILGQPTNVANSTYPARSNLEYLIGGGPLTDTSLGTSGVMQAVAIPIDVGTTVTKISVLVGATAASTPTHSFGALYSGTNVAAPPLIGQSTDATTAAAAASTRFDITLTAAQTITSAQAPFGYIWAAILFTGTGTPTVVTVPTGATATQYQWFTNTLCASSGFAITSGSSITTTATATLVQTSVRTTAPVVFLT